MLSGRGMTDIKKMSVKEFRERGYLQELNRQFLHPLGLALAIVVEADGTERFGEIWDSRDDPEGFIYDSGLIDTLKATKVDKEAKRKANFRKETLGYVIQPPL